MKKTKNIMKRIAVTGLAVVLLNSSFPAAAFAAEIDEAETAILLDEEPVEEGDDATCEGK